MKLRYLPIFCGPSSSQIRKFVRKRDGCRTKPRGTYWGHSRLKVFAFQWNFPRSVCILVQEALVHMQCIYLFFKFCSSALLGFCQQSRDAKVVPRIQVVDSGRETRERAVLGSGSSVGGTGSGAERRICGNKTARQALRRIEWEWEERMVTLCRRKGGWQGLGRRDQVRQGQGRSLSSLDLIPPSTWNRKQDFHSWVFLTPLPLPCACPT